MLILFAAFVSVSLDFSCVLCLTGSRIGVCPFSQGATAFSENLGLE